MREWYWGSLRGRVRLYCDGREEASEQYEGEGWDCIVVRERGGGLDLEQYEGDGWGCIVVGER